MHLTLEEAKRLFPDAIPPQDKPFELTPEKQKYRYLEEQVQKQCVATFRDFQVKGMFKTVPDLEYIEGFWMPQFGEKSKDKQKQIIQGKRNKDMGYKAGTPDGHLLWKLKGKNPRIGYLETKSPDGGLSDGQRDLHGEFYKYNIPIAVIRSHDDFMRTLKRWQILPPMFVNNY